eukprot:4425106-Lingulodinium_polyedra.AAC.1
MLLRLNGPVSGRSRGTSANHEHSVQFSTNRVQQTLSRGLRGLCALLDRLLLGLCGLCALLHVLLLRLDVPLDRLGALLGRRAGLLDALLAGGCHAQAVQSPSTKAKLETGTVVRGLPGENREKAGSSRG